MILKLDLQRFAGSPAAITIVFDNHITKVTAELVDGTHEWTTSGTRDVGTAGDGNDYTFNVTLKDGYIIDNVTADSTDVAVGTIKSISDTSFIVTAGSGGIGQTFTITSKKSSGGGY